MYKVKMYVTYKDGVFDPAGATTSAGLNSLGYSNVSKVSLGKYLVFNIAEDNEEKAKSQIKEMAEKLLTNPVIEKYTYEMEKI